MNIISRFSATLMASVDKSVTQIENHDAVVEASLKETQRAAAKAKVRLQRVRRDGKTLQDRQLSLQQKIEHWTERARQNHLDNRALALDCVARRKQCIAEEQSVKAALAQHTQLEQQLSQSIAAIETRVTTMSQQRNQMRSREAAAQALRIINQIEGNDSGGIDDTFERWDLSIIETEISAGANASMHTIDSLDAQFIAEERQEEMESDLDALVAGDIFSEQGTGAQ